VTSLRELLVQEVGRLSEAEAREVLELLRTKRPPAVAPERPKPTREELIRRAVGHPGIHAPDLNAPRFGKVEPIECAGIPASELLIRDRR